MSNTYADRNRTLETMGFATYAAYLEGALWRSIKIRAFCEHGTNCKLCSKAANVIHHLSYGREVLTGGCLKNLVPLCHGCHKRLEFGKTGRKLRLAQVQTRYRRVMKCRTIETMKSADNNQQWLSLEWRTLNKTCLTCGYKLSKKLTPCKVCKREGRQQIRAIDVTLGRVALTIPEFALARGPRKRPKKVRPPRLQLPEGYPFLPGYKPGQRAIARILKRIEQKKLKEAAP